MRLNQLRDYLTMAEIAQKWKATGPEMCRAVLKGLLRPSLYLNADLRSVEVTESGLRVLDRAPECVTGWHYLTPIQQVGALDCTAQTVAIVQETSRGAALWALDQPLRMEDVMRESVVMAEDLMQAEAALEADSHWQQRSAKTKEFSSVLNTLSIVLADAYRFDPRARCSLVRDLKEAGEKHGIALSAGTITKWIREAVEQFPPGYMNEPHLRPTKELAG